MAGMGGTSTNAMAKPSRGEMVENESFGKSNKLGFWSIFGRST